MQKKLESEQITLRADEQVDELHLGGLKIIQNTKAFLFGIDAVLLAWFAQVRQNERAVDLCCGNGIVPILMSAKNSSVTFTGIELQEATADCAERSVCLNGLQERIKILRGDITHIADFCERGFADVVTVNPPYMKVNSQTACRADPKSIARHELFCTLHDVAVAANYLLKSRGRLFMIHKAFRLAEICTELSSEHLEVKRMQFVQPFVDSEPTIVLIEARKNAQPDVKIEAPIIVYKEKGVYSEQINVIYGR